MTRTDYLNYYKWWVYACISTTAQSLASLNYHILNKEWGKEIKNDYINLLSYNLFEAVVAYMKLTGSAYIWKQTIGGKVRNLYVLRPDLISCELSKETGRVLSYKYSLSGKTLTFQAEEVIAIHNFNPKSAFPFAQTGFSEVQAVSVALDTDNASQVYNWKFFENGGSVGTVLETEKQLSDVVIERLKSGWEEKYSNVNNSHKPTILESGLKMVQSKATQKDMDFVEQRRFSRDEILAIFKMPKIILGLGESINRATAEVQEYIFGKYVIYPIAVKIQDALNAELFNNSGYFEFMNIVPDDKDATRGDWTSGIITLNEARQARNLLPLADGDRTNDFGVFGSTPVVDEEKSLSPIPMLGLSKAIKEAVPHTEEYSEKMSIEKNKRNDSYEVKYAETLTRIFTRQEKDLLDQVKKSKKAPNLNPRDYQALYFTLLRPLYRDIVAEEGKTAYDALNISGVFNADDKEVKKIIQANILKMGKEVDLFTQVKLSEAFAEWLSTDETVDAIRGVFTTLKTTRLTNIVRTETTKISNQASREAYVQSKVVTKMKWFTAQDDRVSDLCASLHGKTVGVQENFFNQGDKYKYPTGDGSATVTFDYDAVGAPPAHPRCRCTIIPVIERS